MAGKNQKALNDIDAALAYMEQKYGEGFQYVSPATEGFSTTIPFWASCASLPGQKVYVQIAKHSSGDRTFSDNYIAAKYEQQARDFLLTCAQAELGEAIVHYSTYEGPLSGTLQADASFIDFLSDPMARMPIYIEAKASSLTSETQADRLASSIAVYGTRYWLLLVFVEDEQFGSYTADGLSDLIGQKKFAYCAYIAHDADGIEISWQEKE